MRGHKRMLRIWLAIMILVPLAGCGWGTSDLEDYVAEVKARKSGDIEPIPEIPVFLPHTYDPGDRRDPFEPLEFAMKGPPVVKGGIRPDLNRIREPLEAFPMDALRMVGTLQVQGTIYALIRGGDGIVHRVTLGNYMGQQFGKIVEISEQQVRVIEVVPDGSGAYMEQPNHLMLIE